MKKINIKSCKAKGRNLQNWVRNKIIKFFPELVNDIKSTPISVTGTDVQLSPLAQRKIPLAIECNAEESVSIWAAYGRACESAKLDNKKKTRAPHIIEAYSIEPVVILKRNRKAPLAVVDAEYLLVAMRLMYEADISIMRNKNNPIPDYEKELSNEKN
jgi:hypothetical protein